MILFILSGHTESSSSGYLEVGGAMID